MDVEHLHEQAIDREGLDDFGVPSYREGLEVLVADLAGPARLNDIGTAAAEAQLVGVLANRLRVTAWVADHPDVMARPIEHPLVLAGMMRTGTTALSHLLGLDPANRSLRGWEAAASVPPPEPRRWRSDPRYLAAVASQDTLHLLNPAFRAIHHDPPDAPTECVTVLGQHATSIHWETLFNAPGYAAWIDTADYAPAYEWHRTVLSVLQSSWAGRWQLKTPQHGYCIDTLLATYPDARVVLTHRDPVTVVASVCSLVRSLSGTFSDADHWDHIVARWRGVVTTIADRLIAARDRYGDERFIDVPYRDVVADPVAVVRRIYGATGDELPASVESAMRSQASAHPQHGYGVHRYDLAGTGLDRAALDERFTPYRERFGVPRDV